MCLVEEESLDGVAEPSAVAGGCPVSLVSEQPVDVGTGERPQDVGGFVIAELGADGIGAPDGRQGVSRGT